MPTSRPELAAFVEKLVEGTDYYTLMGALVRFREHPHNSEGYLDGYEVVYDLGDRFTEVSVSEALRQVRIARRDEPHVLKIEWDHRGPDEGVDVLIEHVEHGPVPLAFEGYEVPGVNADG